MRRSVYRIVLGTLIGTLLFMSLVALSYLGARRAVTQEFRQRARTAAAAGVALLNVEDVERLHDPAQIDSFEYRRLLSRLRRVGEVVPGARRTMLLRRTQTAKLLEVVAEELLAPGPHEHGGTGPVSRPAKLGDAFDPSSFPELTRGFDDLTADEDVHMVAGEELLSGYAPLTNVRGEAEAVFAVALEARPLLDQRSHLRSDALVLVAVALSLAAAAAAFYLRKERDYLKSASSLEESRQDLTRMVLGEKELTRKNRELQALIAVSEQLSGSFELSRNLHRSLDCLLDVAGIDGTIIRLIDQETRELYLAAHRGLSPLLFEGYQRIPVGHSFSGSVAASGEALFVENIPATFGSRSTSPFDKRIRSYAIAPLKVQDRILGTLTLFSLSDPKFPWPYRSMIFSVTHQLAVAVENANLLERERKRSAQLTLIADISKRVSITMNVDELLQMAIERIQKEFRFFFIAYYEVDDAQGLCLRKAESGGFFEMGYGDLNYRQPLDQGMISVAHRQRRTVHVADASAEEGFVGVPGNLAKSELVVPLIVDNEVVGLFDLQSTMIRGFTREDILMMETLADQIAIAIKNRRTYAQLQQASTSPIADCEETAAMAPDVSTDAPKKLRILVVDDEEYVLTLIAEVLSMNGNQVIVAKSGPEGLEHFSRDAFDIVFTDKGLPGMDGLAVASSMKSSRPTVPVVLLTGYGVALDEADVRRHGVDRILAKPFRVQELLDCVAEVVPA